MIKLKKKDSGEKDLDTLLKNMSPKLNVNEFVFLTLKGKYGDYLELEPICSFMEEEGLTLVVPKEKAIKYDMSFEGVYKQITLTVHSSLDAVGLTAAVSSKLASDGISANVIAAFYHDHIFIQSEFADRALSSLNEFINPS